MTYTNLQRTLLAIDTAIEEFGFQRVFVYLAEWIEYISRFSVAETVPLDRFVQSYGHDPAGVMFWEGYGLISGGRAGYSLGEFTELLPPEAFRDETCAGELLAPAQSHLDLYGNYIAGFCAGLSLGDWKRLPALVEEFSRGVTPPLVGILLQQGPYGLYELARREHGYQLLEGGYAGKCHLCVDVRQHLAQYEHFSELTPREFYKSLRRKIPHA